ncbi:MAG: AraC family transcriptional regulator [Pigmentiphaga sp.]|uniref:helix-turn-helix transcriptional regulator n=1 Tax=Pigmentiphaga sp. TaxID=1977564 RepID=UPI003B53BF53
MSGVSLDPVPVRSYADETVGPRFGIRSERMNGGRHLLHKHDYFEVLFFVSSAEPQRIAIREHVARRGSIFFVSPMTPHQARFDASHACFVMYFDLEFLRPDLKQRPMAIDAELLARVPELAPFVYQQNVDFMLSGADIDILKALCDRMLAEHLAPRLCSDEIIRSCLTMLLAEVTQRYEERILALIDQHPPLGGAERHVKAVMDYIDAHVDRRMSLADAAGRAAVSPNYLANLLKRETGKTFVELATERRMAHASQLLAYSRLRVSQVAEAAGFSDIDYFCRRFKQVVGCTPLEFRSRHTLERR